MVRARTTRPKRELTPSMYGQMLHGRSFWRDDFGNDLDAMYQAWSNQDVQERVYREHYQKHGHRCTRPFGWWQFNSSERRDPSIADEAEQLRRMGELTDQDMRQLYDRECGDNRDYPAFRRPISWWWFHTTEGRDYGTPEGLQLERIGALTEGERGLLKRIQRFAAARDFGGLRGYEHLFPFIFPRDDWLRLIEHRNAQLRSKSPAEMSNE